MRSFRTGGMGLIGAVLVLIAVFMSNGSPILLYERYRVELGLSTGDLSMTSVVLIGTALTGIGQGIAFTGSIRGLMLPLEPGQRAAMMSIVYIVAYGGAAVPTFIFGQLGEVMAMWQIGLCFTALTVIAVAMVLLCPRPTGRSPDQPA